MRRGHRANNKPEGRGERAQGRQVGRGVRTGEKTPYLAGPDGGDEVAAVLEDIKDLYDASGVAKHGDAGVRHGQVKGQVVGGLQCGLLPEQDEENNAVPKPGQPTYRDKVSFCHSSSADNSC